MLVVAGLAITLNLAIAAPKAKPPKPPSTTTTTKVADAQPLPDTKGLTTTALVALARQQYDALEYDRVAKLAEEALARPDPTLDEKLDAYALQGSALAIVADPIDAEKPFRLLLRARPEFNLPDATPPKILAVFRKVQVEEKAIVDEFAAIQRQRLSATLKLTGDAPAGVRGGRAVRFGYRLRDPQGAVESVRVQYRRKGEGEFTSLPLKRDDGGLWSGRIPGEWTVNEGGFVLEYVVVAGDDKGTLISLGTPAAPRALDVAAGQVDKNAHPVPAWGFWTAAGATGVVGVTAGALAATTAWLNADYHRQLDESTAERPADGAALARQADLGNSVMVAQFVGWGVTGLGVVVSGLLAPFTNWTGETLDEGAAPTAATTTAATTTAATTTAATTTAATTTAATTTAAAGGDARLAAR
jgi:hypothetical protein